MLRELAIHQNNQESDIRRRQRLIIEVVENEFPSWLDKMDDPEMNAHMLSISTGLFFSASLIKTSMQKYLGLYNKISTASN